jgi:hypothetical protein
MPDLDGSEDARRNASLEDNWFQRKWTLAAQTARTRRTG